MLTGMILNGADEHAGVRVGVAVLCVAVHQSERLLRYADDDASITHTTSAVMPASAAHHDT